MRVMLRGVEEWDEREPIGSGCCVVVWPERLGIWGRDSGYRARLDEQTASSSCGYNKEELLRWMN